MSSFTRPTLQQLVDRIQSDFRSRLSSVGALLRRSMVYIFARVLAGASHMLHGHLEWLSRQIFADQSDDDFLVRQSGLFGVTKDAASYAQLSITATGTNGSVIPGSTTKLLSASGLEYIVDADATISGGTATITATAALAGSDSNLAPTAQLSFESPVAGVDSTATVAAVVADGADTEDTEGLRTRFLAFLADPPHGGNDADYIEWAKEVAGVTRVWVYGKGLGPGTVLVYFARDNDPSAIPDVGEVAQVQAKFDELAPSHATVTAAAPIDTPENLTIHLSPDTTALRATLTTALTDFYKTWAPGSTILLSSLRTTIGNVVRPGDYTMAVPSADTVLATGHLPRLGTITWT